MAWCGSFAARPPVRRRSRTISLTAAIPTSSNFGAEGQGAEGRQARAVASGRRRRRQVLEPLRSARRRWKGDGRGFLGSPDSHSVDPKGGVSFTYKWHATNEPVDPYWHVRDPGPDTPGSTFLGGLKLGF